MKNRNYYLLISLHFFLTQSVFHKTEFSSKTGKEEPRYVSKFKKLNTLSYEDKSHIENISVRVIDEIIGVLNKTGELSKRNSWFSQIKSENIYVSVADLGGHRLTIEAKDGDFEFIEDLIKKKPSMVLKVKYKNIKDY